MVPRAKCGPDTWHNDVRALRALQARIQTLQHELAEAGAEVTRLRGEVAASRKSADQRLRQQEAEWERRCQAAQQETAREVRGSLVALLTLVHTLTARPSHQVEKHTADRWRQQAVIARNRLEAEVRAAQRRAEDAERAYVRASGCLALLSRAASTTSWSPPLSARNLGHFAVVMLCAHQVPGTRGQVAGSGSGGGDRVQRARGVVSA